jgi:SAM-dependent methyltransferase
MSKPQYLTPYKDWIDCHGPCFGATLWASPESQRIRFEVLTQMLYLPGKRILDAGCSRGDLASYLLSRDLDYSQYIGIDGMSEAIDYAQKKHIPRSRFICGDFLADPTLLQIDQPQVIFLSGTLNTMTDAQAFQTLEHCWNATERYLVFNFLPDTCDEKAPPQDQIARRLPTMAIMNWAFEKTWSVVFRQDYFDLGHDATIMMEKK